jgi:hypothetical protein
MEEAGCNNWDAYKRIKVAVLVNFNKDDFTRDALDPLHLSAFCLFSFQGALFKRLLQYHERWPAPLLRHGFQVSACPGNHRLGFDRFSYISPERFSVDIALAMSNASIADSDAALLRVCSPCFYEVLALSLSCSSSLRRLLILERPFFDCSCEVCAQYDGVFEARVESAHFGVSVPQGHQ